MKPLAANLSREQAISFKFRVSRRLGSTRLFFVSKNIFIFSKLMLDF